MNPLAETRSHLGHLRSYLYHDTDSAMIYFERALAASPNNSLAWILSSATLNYVGRSAQAVRHAEQGIRLSPYDRSLFYYYSFLGLAHYGNGALEDAVTWGQMALNENPSYTSTLRNLAAALVALGRIDDGREAARKMLALEPDFRLSTYENTRNPFRHAAQRRAFMEHLRASGLPE